ncbi:craniofacial development protein 2-like [Ostrinia furnacalis]|uniref:craniofacial development protein 2-like n=1 Tax=Ostrinia furnacalis TaxID=93504 RepID=UPI00103F7773|nr:craniofacial development protein 2-like [Ostrinia furnacalis]
MKNSQEKDKKSPCDPASNRRRTTSGVNGGKCVTGHAIVVDQASQGNSATGKTFKLREDKRIGTWNVRGLLMAGKLNILENEILRCGVEVCGLSETHWKGQGHFLTDKNVIYFSGNDNESINGVAFLLPRQLRHCVLGYEPVSDRIMSIKLKATPINLNIVQVYAPTSSYSIEMLENFYSDLERTISKIPSREMLMIIGDLNAKIGENAQTLGHVAGPYGLGKRNERGERLIQFAAEKNLIIANSLFRHHPRRLYTWTSPDGNYKNQIDYILIKSRWRTSIKNAHTLPGADCGSDHQLLIARIQLKLKAARKESNKRRMEVKDNTKFIAVLEKNWDQWIDAKSVGKTSDQLWTSAKTLLESAVWECNTPSTTVKRQHWMSDDTLGLVEERRRLKSTGANIKKLNSLSAKIQAGCRRDLNNNLRNICAEIEVHADKYETRDLHQKIRSLTRTLSSKTWAIENHNGELITEMDGISETWKIHCEALFQDPNSQEFPSTEPYGSGSRGHRRKLNI